jgi:hypothetical protein
MSHRLFEHTAQKGHFCGRADLISLEFCAVQSFTCFPFVSEVSFPLTGMVRCSAVNSVRDLTLLVSCGVLRVRETNMKRDHTQHFNFSKNQRLRLQVRAVVKENNTLQVSKWCYGNKISTNTPLPIKKNF